MVLRKKEVDAWFQDQKTLLQRQHEEKGIMKAAKKRLTAIERSLHRNNEKLRRDL